MVRRASALVRRVFCPACWCSSHSVRLDGGLPCVIRVFLREPFQFAGDGDGAGAEQVHHVLADPADLGAVAVFPRDHGIPSADSLVSMPRSVTGATREPLVVQGPGVQGAPFAVCAVAALHPVPDRQRAHAAGGRRRGTGGAGTSWRPGRPRRATPRSVPNGARCGYRWHAGPASSTASRAESISASSIWSASRVERGGLFTVSVLAGLSGRDPVGGVQHRHALDRADGQVEIRHLVRVLAALGRADLGQLGRAGVRVRGPVRRHRGFFPLLGRLGLAAADQQLPARPDALLVQPADHGRVDLAGQPERRGALPGPLPWRLPGRGVVGHSAGAAAARAGPR